MDESMKKLLTEEVLKECWHLPIDEIIGGIRTFYSCTKCGRYDGINRTFTTGNDMIALKDRIEYIGEWQDFEGYCYDEWDKSTYQPGSTFMAYMINPVRFCDLVASWWEERKVKG